MPFCKRSTVRRRYGQMRRFMRGRERTTKASIKFNDWFLFLLFAKVFPTLQEGLRFCGIQFTSTEALEKGYSQVIFRPEQEQVPAPADILKQVRTIVKKRCVKAGPPPPLDLSFWSFLTFLHHSIEEVEGHLLWKFYKNIRRKSWSNVPPKLVACIGFLYKVVHKIGRLRKFNRSRGI